VTEDNPDVIVPKVKPWCPLCGEELIPLADCPDCYFCDECKVDVTIEAYDEEASE
jgi:hypothetical protein